MCTFSLSHNQIRGFSLSLFQVQIRHTNGDVDIYVAIDVSIVMSQIGSPHPNSYIKVLTTNKYLRM